MSEKVKVSKEVAESLRLFEESKLSRETILLNYAAYIHKAEVLQFNLFKTFADDCIGLLDLSKILINGYEVEQTPEEKAVTYYNMLTSSAIPENNSIALCIYHFLDLAEIKIKGVNE